MAAAPDRVDAAWRMLAELGVTITDLRDDLRSRRPMPTVAEYLPQVAAAAGPGARRTYGSYWTRMRTLWGQRRLDEIAATDIEALRYEAASSARSRRNSRSGRHAGEHVIAAARAVFNRAIADGLIDRGATSWVFHWSVLSSVSGERSLLLWRQLSEGLRLHGSKRLLTLPGARRLDLTSLHRRNWTFRSASARPSSSRPPQLRLPGRVRWCWRHAQTRCRLRTRSVKLRCWLP